MNGRKNGSAISGSAFLASQLDKYGFYLFQTFLDSSQSLCWIADRNKKLVFANIALLRYFELNKVEHASKLNVVYQNNSHDIEALDGSKKFALYRIVQEHFKNIIKHAKAKSVHISIKDRHGLLELEINDDGVGFDTHRVRRGVGFPAFLKGRKFATAT